MTPSLTQVKCLDKDTMHFKSHISSIFGELLYDAKWDTLLRESLSCFVNKTQELVTGEVKLILYIKWRHLCK